MYGHDKMACDVSPSKANQLGGGEVQPNGLLNSIHADLCHLSDIAGHAACALRELRSRTLGSWPEESCATGTSREPSSKSEELANTIGNLRYLLLDVREQAVTLNREI